MDRSDSKTTGTLYGVGVGPGDPELITLKAARLITDCALITYISSTGGHSMSRSIAAGLLDGAESRGQIEYPIVMPMCDNRELANSAYDQGADRIRQSLDAGDDVVFLCEGDPFFFGSFAYLHDRLAAAYDVKVIPGVMSLTAAAAATGHAMGLLGENVAVISGRRDDGDILDTLARFDNVAIMKPGRRRAKLVELIQQAGRSDRAIYLEYVGHEKQRIETDISQLGDAPGPYFSLFILRRPRDFLQHDS
ncbi:MAG: precorrin-2 C(20)-methyltransferase [Pseudomonadota bacterium]